MELALFGGEPVRQKRIYYSHQYIDDQDVDAVVETLKSDFLTCGPKISELEEKLCSLTGAKYAVAVSNGTAALHAACYAAGIESGDEVITTPMTFAASANCVLYCGGKPVFADINLKTYNIDPIQIEKNITSNTKAVIAVDFTGQAVELEQIKDICNKNNLVLIEDAAHAIGTRYDGEMVGSIADMTTFSFHPVKTITGGEGGAILTDNEFYYRKLLLFRAHGITRDTSQMSGQPHGEWYYEQIDLGYNYRMTDFQAALIISQLDKMHFFMSRRKEIAREYDNAFSDMPQMILQKEIPESDTVRHLYIIQFELSRLRVGRKELYEALKAENICCNVHYIPVYYFPFYQKLGYKIGTCPNAEYLYDRILSIPFFAGMKDEDVKDVISAIKKVVEFYSKEVR